LVDIGSYALDGLRIEAGIRAWGAEFGPDDADDDQLVRLVLDRDTRAPGQPTEPAWAWGGEPVLRGDTVIGRITSAGWSSLAGACVAHVRLEPGAAAPANAAVATSATATTNVTANATAEAPADADHLSAGWPVQLELCSEHGTGHVPARLWSHWRPPGWPGRATPAS
jgi:glycine cleavage system aminomethyltransferase T